MPSVKKNVLTRLWLPSTKDEPDEDNRAWVDVKTNLLLSDYLELNEADSEKNRTLYMLNSIIADWNFTDADSGEKLEITPEMIDDLAGRYISDFTYIGEWVAKHLEDSLGGLSNDEKKDLFSNSTPELTANPSPPTI